MAKYKILIVDDEESRVPKYQSLFKVDKTGDFELEFATKSFSDFLEKNSQTFHCYVVDISLNKWNDTKDLTADPFKHVLETIGDKKPIVLLSSEWKNVITWLNDFIHKHNIVTLIDWMAIERQDESTALASGMVYNNMLAALKKIYQFSDFNKQDNEPINILHISDLQFGELNREDNTGVRKQMLIDELLNEIPNYLSNKQIRVDFIVVTGDITESALPSEFETAEKWLTKFCEKIFGSYNADRLLLTNGNHDYNLSLNSLNYFKFKYGSSPLEMERMEQITDYMQMAFLPYRQFLSKMTNESFDSMTYYNNKFQHLGIRFLHLNTLETYNVENSSSEDIFNITNDTFKDIIDDVQNNNNQIFTIILSHASPKNLGYMTQNTEKKTLWERFENSASRFCKSLLLSGHEHTDSYLSSIPIKNGANLYSSVAPTLLSKPEESGITRGFYLLTLERESKKVKKIKNQLYMIDSKRAIVAGDNREISLE